MTRRLSVLFVIGALLAVAVSAAAEPTAWRGSVDMNVNVEIGGDGFRLGGSITGLEGVYGAWINGTLHRDGLTVDGRVEQPERTHGFTLNADISKWLRPSTSGPDNRI